MKTLIVVRWPVGGIRTYLKYMLNHESLCEHEYMFIVPDTHESRTLQNSLTDIKTTFSFIKPSSMSFISHVYKSIKKFKPDLIHCHGFQAGISAVVANLVSRTPILLSSHDVFHDYHFEGLSGKSKKIALSWLLRQFNCVNLLGRDAETNFFEYFPNFPKQKVSTIRNGVDTQKFFNAEPKSLKEQLGLSDDVYLIGFLGRFMNQKGFKYLLEAFQLIYKEVNRPVYVVSIGANGGFEVNEKEHLKKLGLIDYFKFIPFEENVGGVLKTLDVLAIPSVWECCPLLPMESLAAGTPIIGSNCIGLKEILEGSPAKMFESKNSSKLAELLKDTINDTEWRIESKNYSPIATEKFNFENSAKELGSLYISLFENRYAARA